MSLFANSEYSACFKVPGLSMLYPRLPLSQEMLFDVQVDPGDSCVW